MGETRKLAAILVADVVGYTRLAGADEDRILARLRTLRSDLIDPTIAVHHGRIVKRTGDGSIIEFRSVVDAVNCAIEVQRAMVERNAEVAPDKRIEFRIGIHLGDVVEEDEIVTRLANAMHLQLPEAEAARLKRTPAANPNAEDLALQCEGDLLKGGVFLGKEADVAYHLCEQALAVDPNNDRALSYLSTKYWLPVGMGVSADPKADLERADELASRAIALNPNADHQHNMKAMVLLNQARYDESIAESERALALNPSNVFAYMGLGWACFYSGRFEKSLEYFDKAIRLSPHDPGMGTWLDSKSAAYFALKQYDQAIEWARRAVVIDPSFGADLVAPLALSGHETEAREALQRYLALPSSDQPKTIAGWKAYNGHFVNANTDPRLLEAFDRFYEAVRKAGMPEK